MNCDLPFSGGWPLGVKPQQRMFVLQVKGRLTGWIWKSVGAIAAADAVQARSFVRPRFRTVCADVGLHDARGLRWRVVSGVSDGPARQCIERLGIVTARVEADIARDPAVIDGGARKFAIQTDHDGGVEIVTARLDRATKW